jgi:sulfur-oxidizing protein SoxZ
MADAMKIRANLQGDVADVRVLISHPMETGQRKDRKTGELIPIHYITRVVATVNGKTVLDADWSQAVSKNPFVAFKVKGAKAGDKVIVSWEDNRGAKDSVETTISGG